MLVPDRWRIEPGSPGEWQMKKKKADVRTIIAGRENLNNLPLVSYLALRHADKVTGLEGRHGLREGSRIGQT